MEIEPRLSSESKDERQIKDDLNPIMRKENLITTYKSFMTFLVKQLTFDVIPLNEYEQIYSEDPIATLKNQIKYFSTLLLKCAKTKQNILNEADLFTYLVECDQQRYQNLTHQVITQIVDLTIPDFKTAFEKEIKLKKPTHFDPDFNGTVQFQIDSLQLEYKSYKDKVYPKVIISSFRKIIRMIIIIEKVFIMLHKKLPLSCVYLFHYGKNQSGKELPDTLLFDLKDGVALRIDFIKMGTLKTELGNM